ncbi:MAG TPA: hypothetical protein VM715_21365 [Candidatus Acidoferrum sp.]|nr:hypothetical protein [Candidatus Acidoferrum sp.]
MNFNVGLLQVLTLLVNLILPLVVGFVTTMMTSAKFQAILLALLTAITGFISEWIQALQSNSQFDFWAAVFTWLTGFVTAVAAHYGFWKPTGATARVLSSGRRGRHEAA